VGALVVGRAAPAREGGRQREHLDGLTGRPGKDGPGTARPHRGRRCPSINSSAIWSSTASSAA
jgi:hypothetical protein